MKAHKKVVAFILICSLVMSTNCFAGAYQYIADKYEKTLTLTTGNDSWEKKHEFSADYGDGIVHYCTSTIGFTDGLFSDKDYMDMGTCNVATQVYVKESIFNDGKNVETGYVTNGGRLGKITIDHENSKTFFYMTFRAN